MTQNTSVSEEKARTKNCCRFLHPKSICAEERAEITAPDVAELEKKKQNRERHAAVESVARQKHRDSLNSYPGKV